MVDGETSRGACDAGHRSGKSMHMVVADHRLASLYPLPIMCEASCMLLRGTEESPLQSF